MLTVSGLGKRHKCKEVPTSIDTDLQELTALHNQHTSSSNAVLIEVRSQQSYDSEDLFAII